MTDAGWAERKVEQATTGYSWNARIRKSTVILPSIAAKLLLAEHKRAVRVVKRKIADLEVIRSRSFCNAEIAEAYASITVLRDILAALQRGRTGRGK